MKCYYDIICTKKNIDDDIKYKKHDSNESLKAYYIFHVFMISIENHGAIPPAPWLYTHIHIFAPRRFLYFACLDGHVHALEQHVAVNGDTANFEDAAEFTV